MSQDDRLTLFGSFTSSSSFNRAGDGRRERVRRQPQGRKVQAPLAGLLAQERFDVILNATAFSARARGRRRRSRRGGRARAASVMAGAGARGNGQARRAASAPADLAMHVVLPEIDGRILTRAISFKAGDAAQRPARIHANFARAGAATASAFVADLAARLGAATP